MKPAREAENSGLIDGLMAWLAADYSGTRDEGRRVYSPAAR